MSQVYHYEDLEEGRVFRSGPYALSADEIKDFATRYDPQPFHLDEAAAEDSFFQGLAASGWHTAAITMRLMVDTGLKTSVGLIGAGIEAMKWHRPVRPGDVLRVEIRILERRIMRSKPDTGLVRIETLTLDAEGRPVQTLTAHILAPLRGAAV